MEIQGKNSPNSREVFIVAAKRTPVGRFLGQLQSVSAPRLGALAISAALAQCEISRDAVDEVYMGQVLTAGCGQAPARQSALFAELPNHVSCTTVSKVCGSGLMSVILGMQSIQLGNAEVVVCGGQESMSQAPYALPQAREGLRMGHKNMVDTMIHDGLWDVYHQKHMGTCAELCVQKYGFDRKIQDDFATESYRRARQAISDQKFSQEIVSVSVKKGKESFLMDCDEEPLAGDLAKLPLLKPAFDTQNGTITAGNASKINDGAAAVILASAEAVKNFRLKPLARIVNFGRHAHEPELFTTAPVGAIQKVLEKSGKKISEIDLFEINEAFAAVPLAAMKDLEIPHSKVNVKGGACAIGHPIGASGARILTTLIYNLLDFHCQTGLASLCIGGGEALSLLIDRSF